MQVRALQSFADLTGRHSPGDVFEMPDGEAVVRIKAGLVRRVPDEPQTATVPEPELAVVRAGRKRGM